MRVGFVGLGFATRSLHVPAIASLPSAVIVGGVDPAPEQTAAWHELGAGPVHDSLDELLELGRPDVIVVATPPDSHAALCIQALEAGVDVMCEKPFVATVDEADAVLAVADRTGRWVAVNQEFRYMPIFAETAKRVGTPRVGRPVFVHCTQFMDLAPWDEPVAWRAAMPDRALFEGGVHLVDLLHLLVGRHPRAVFAAMSSGLDPVRRADAVDLVTFDYGDGLLAQITINRLSKSGTRYVDLRVDCEAASLRASYGGRAFVRLGMKRAEVPGIRIDFGPEGLAWIERGLRRRVIARNARGATVKATQALYEATFAAVGRGVLPPTDAHLARETLRVIEAAYRSARTGERVELTPG
jgi:predicted dehydrogenase